MLEILEPYFPGALSALVAGLLTYCDLHTVFDAPPYAIRWRLRLRLCFWWWGFVLANALLAALVSHILRPTYLKDYNIWLASAVAGVAYTALVRAQITTLPVNGKNIPFGFETFYEGIKGLVHSRINDVIRKWRTEQCEVLAELELSTLRSRATLLASSDALLTQEARDSSVAWISSVVNNVNDSAEDKKRALAVYIITGYRGTPS